MGAACRRATAALQLTQAEEMSQLAQLLHVEILRTYQRVVGVELSRLALLMKNIAILVLVFESLLWPVINIIFLDDTFCHHHIFVAYFEPLCFIFVSVGNVRLPIVGWSVKKSVLNLFLAQL